MQRIRRGSILGVLGLVCLFNTELRAADVAPFPSKVTLGERTLLLNGDGLCEWGIFGIDLYTAALYVETPSTDAEKIIARREAKRVELRFIRSLTQKQMRKAYTVAFEMNAGKQLPKYKKGLDQLLGYLEKVSKHDVLAFTYDPEKKATRVEFKGKVKGWIEGEESGRMFVRLYLGPKPPDKNLRRAMLAAKTPAPQRKATPDQATPDQGTQERKAVRDDS